MAQPYEELGSEQSAIDEPAASEIDASQATPTDLTGTEEYPVPHPTDEHLREINRHTAIGLRFAVYNQRLNERHLRSN